MSTSVHVKPEGWIGWCHSCETYQHGSDARMLGVHVGWGPEWSCVKCREPWSHGVFEILCPACLAESPDDPKVIKTIQVADEQLQLYPNSSFARCLHGRNALDNTPRPTSVGLI